MTFSLVIPTIGRASLRTLLDSLERCDGPRPERVVIVDDRPRPAEPLAADLAGGWVAERYDLRRSGGRGPAAARNVGWRSVGSEWIVFVDDDVVLSPGWLCDLADDLDVPSRVGGVQGVVSVALPRTRRPTDAERNTAALATSRWITADMAYRRSALAEVRGFDERFTRAFREDADIALRIMARGCELCVGRRRVDHPVRPAPWYASISAQRGNADDALIRALRGKGWYRLAEARRGRRPAHLVAAGAALMALATARWRPRAASAAAATWAALTVEFAARRIFSGPSDRREVAAMVATSIAIPFAATWHWLRGTFQYRGAPPWEEMAPAPVAAVLFDRDGTLVADVPYNGDPTLVRLLPGVSDAVERLRGAGVRIGVVTNQSGVARHLITLDQVSAVNHQLEKLVGPIDTWQVCPHGVDDECGCRKPRPGLIQAASHDLGVAPQQCVVVGDTAADLAAAKAAGAVGVLVPNEETRIHEVLAADLVCQSISAGVDVILGARP